MSGCEDDVRHIKGELVSHWMPLGGLFGGVNRWKVGYRTVQSALARVWTLAPLDALYIGATGPPVSSRRSKYGNERSSVRIYMKVTVVWENGNQRVKTFISG